MISIFVPLYNASAFITQTLQSILDQTFQDWEVLVLDDCSTDDSFEVAKIFAQKDTRFTILRNDKNLGMMQNWNKGIDLCKHEFFVKLDADDIWENTFLEKSYNIMQQNSNVALIFTKFVNIDQDNQKIPNSEIILPEFAQNKAFNTVELVKSGEDKMLAHSILRQGLSLIRKEVFEKIGKYRFLLTEKTQASTDTEFYFRVGCHYDIFCIDETLYLYRVHDKSISQTDIAGNLATQKMYETKYCILTYFFEKGKIDAIFYKKNIQKIQLQYNFEQSYQARIQKKYAKSIIFILKNFWLNPLKTINFYIKRLKK